MKIGILVAVAACACSKREASDCEVYAIKFADASESDPTRHDSVQQAALEACRNGRVTGGQRKCVAEASSGAQLKACFGMGTSDAAPGSVPKAERSPKVEAYAINQGTSDLDPQAMKDDQKAWFQAIQTDIAACATGTGFTRREPVVVLTFRDKGETWVDAHEVPALLRDCVEKAVKIPHPASITHGMSELTLYIGH